MKIKSTRHTVYQIAYHLVWVTKYRRAVLDETVQARLKTLLPEIAAGAAERCAQRPPGRLAEPGATPGTESALQPLGHSRRGAAAMAPEPATQSAVTTAAHTAPGLQPVGQSHRAGLG